MDLAALFGFIIFGTLAPIFFLLAFEVLRTPRHVWEARRKRILEQRRRNKEFINFIEGTSEKESLKKNKLA